MPTAAIEVPERDRERSQSVGFRPLYRQVRDLLVRRLADGHWQPGQPLPSEHQLAQELGVSQGTVRKALDAMTYERLLVRQQGRGTFVAELTEQHILFNFFKLVRDDGVQRFPLSRVVSVLVTNADEDERARLGLGEGARVIRIRRLRSLADETVIVEDIVVPAAIFATLADAELPNNLYGVYASQYRVTVVQACERLKAVSLDGERAALLQVREGTPALRIDRLARDLDNRSVEWRVSFCLTERFHYRSDMR